MEKRLIGCRRGEQRHHHRHPFHYYCREPMSARINPTFWRASREEHFKMSCFHLETCIKSHLMRRNLGTFTSS